MAPRSRLEWSVNIVDWRRDTSHLTPAERGGYMSLLMYYWEHGSLPADDEELRRIAGAESVLVWRQQRRVLKRFFRDGWKHKRMEADLARAAAFSARQRSAARARWKVRAVAVDSGEEQNISRHGQDRQKQKRNQRPNDADAMPLQCSLPKTIKNTFVSGNTTIVEKGQPRQAGASFSQHKPNLKRAAQAAWENNLRITQGPELYAIAIDQLAGDPDLMEQATQAEIERPGSGHTLVMFHLSVREASR